MMMNLILGCIVVCRLFHGFRLDNYHNTPIHVAEVTIYVASMDVNGVLNLVEKNLYKIKQLLLFYKTTFKLAVILQRLGPSCLMTDYSKLMCS